MKRSFLVLLTLCYTLSVWAQLGDVNPNVQWKYVFNFDETLDDGEQKGLEVPLQKGYDYFISLNFPGEEAVTSFQIFDLQESLVKENIDTINKGFSRYHFDVDRTGTYKLFYAMNDPRKGIASRKVTVTIARRLKIK